MSSKLNFWKLRQIPIESVLLEFGCETRRQGNELVVKKCPLPSHVSDEQETFKVGVFENLWRCWSASCRKGKKNGGDVIDLVCELYDLKPAQAAKKLAGISPRVEIRI